MFLEYLLPSLLILSYLKLKLSAYVVSRERSQLR